MPEILTRGLSGERYGSVGDWVGVGGLRGGIGDGGHGPVEHTLGDLAAHIGGILDHRALDRQWRELCTPETPHTYTVMLQTNKYIYKMKLNPYYSILS